MRSLATRLGAGLLLALCLSGCPVTDDFYIDEGLSGAGTGAMLVGGGGSAGTGSGGGASGSGGTTDAGTTMAGTMPMPMPMPMPGGAAGVGGGGSAGETCTLSTERCNGHDDNCDGLIDERVCNTKANGTTGCVGFVLPDRPNHGYMLCPSTPKPYAEAQKACQEQGMRLAWLETKAEDDQVAAKVHAVTNDEISFGANDMETEGDWVWDGVGGFQFWKGNENGKVVDDAFAAWAQGTPNDDNDGEDCAVMNPLNGVWGDRPCSAQYGYLCEEPE